MALAANFLSAARLSGEERRQAQSIAAGLQERAQHSRERAAQAPKTEGVIGIADALKRSAK
ncbi:hypothetical protein HAP48_0042985 [Bradyrhizobium septentrionale]|uniref:Uncharacterized protein n=1 Tax=Bradyrhizobium septentrionale TaxID=1404411 RepID=A0A973W3J8_9BRAD|nr:MULTISPECIES: hypothetical protein [Bradyrhizobium]MCK7671467.1 hypothetical protein [Bradyrhizobium sp. 2S1]UGY15224.1 hypothetical protein HAP48_0042985 [Bradyrhizobium septentrionale]